MGYSPWGCKELDTTERLPHTLAVCSWSHFTQKTARPGEVNGPTQVTGGQRWNTCLGVHFPGALARPPSPRVFSAPQSTPASVTLIFFLFSSNSSFTFHLGS